MPAKLPPELIEPRSRCLRELEVGQECGISFVDLKVDKQGYCYLNPAARISPKANMLEVAVRRDTAGYHVEVRQSFGPRLTFLRKPGWWYTPFRRWIPVESFTEIGEKIKAIS